MHWRRAGVSLCAGAAVAAPLAAAFWDNKFERTDCNRLFPPVDHTCAVDAAIEKARRHVLILKERRAVPGLSVAVSVDGRPAWAEGFGYADVETLAPCAADTVMRIASISKPITATLVARHVQSGKLHLDDSILKWVDYWPTKLWEGHPVDITVRQLLCHSSGVRHYRSAEKDENNNPLIEEEVDTEVYNQKQFKSIEESVALFKDDPLVSKPGSEFAYTTHGYTLLAAVCESVADKPFSHQLEDFFSELGMRNTRLDHNDPIVNGRASYYRRLENGHELTNAPSVNCSYKWAGGGILSTAPDLLVFANHILYSLTSPDGCGDAILKGDIVRQFFKPANVQTSKRKNGRAVENSYALGWYVQPARTQFGGTLTRSGYDFHWNGSDYVVHAGGSVGVSSMLLIKPTRRGQLDTRAGHKGAPGVCVAILANMHGVSALHELAADVAACFVEQL